MQFNRNQSKHAWNCIFRDKVNWILSRNKFKEKPTTTKIHEIEKNRKKIIEF